MKYEFDLTPQQAEALQKSLDHLANQSDEISRDYHPLSPSATFHHNTRSLFRSMSTQMDRQESGPLSSITPAQEGGKLRLDGPGNTWIRPADDVNEIRDSLLMNPDLYEVASDASLRTREAMASFPEASSRVWESNPAMIDVIAADMGMETPLNSPKVVAFMEQSDEFYSSSKLSGEQALGLTPERLHAALDLEKRDAMQLGQFTLVRDDEAVFIDRDIDGQIDRVYQSHQATEQGYQPGGSNSLTFEDRKALVRELVEREVNRPLVALEQDYQYARTLQQVATEQGEYVGGNNYLEASSFDISATSNDVVVYDNVNSVKKFKLNFESGAFEDNLTSDERQELAEDIASRLELDEPGLDSSADLSDPADIDSPSGGINSSADSPQNRDAQELHKVALRYGKRAGEHYILDVGDKTLVAAQDSVSVYEGAIQRATTTFGKDASHSSDLSPAEHEKLMEDLIVSEAMAGLEEPSFQEQINENLQTSDAFAFWVTKEGLSVGVTSEGGVLVTKEGPQDTVDVIFEQEAGEAEPKIDRMTARQKDGLIHSVKVTNAEKNADAIIGLSQELSQKQSTSTESQEASVTTGQPGSAVSVSDEFPQDLDPDSERNDLGDGLIVVDRGDESHIFQDNVYVARIDEMGQVKGELTYDQINKIVDFLQVEVAKQDAEAEAAIAVDTSEEGMEKWREELAEKASISPEHRTAVAMQTPISEMPSRVDSDFDKTSNSIYFASLRATAVIHGDKTRNPNGSDTWSIELDEGYTLKTDGHAVQVAQDGEIVFAKHEYDKDKSEGNFIDDLKSGDKDKIRDLMGKASERSAAKSRNQRRDSSLVPKKSSLVPKKTSQAEMEL